MSIVYTLICKGNDKVLCEFTEYQGNFEQISRSLLKKVQKDKRATFSYADEYFFHYINVNFITYMCMCDNKLSQDSAFAYLEEIRTLFTDTFTPKEIDSAISYSLNDRFKDSIRGKMNYFNANLNESDKVAKLKQGVMDYKDNILQANDILMERGEKINLIVRKADNLRTESQNYLKSVSLHLYY
jgi:vesicle-associated membrane protein 7